MKPEARIYCAGSLRMVLHEVLGERAELTPGPSGVLRQKIEQGDNPDIFISANMKHAQILAESGGYGNPTVLAANQLCLILRPGLANKAGSALDLMLEPAYKLGTSTPGADPGGDYSWQVFERAEKLMPGAKASLENKARCLVGGPGQKFDPYIHPVSKVLLDGQADLFLGYRTTARQVLAQLPGTSSLELPQTLQVQAQYGMVLRRDIPPKARKTADYLLSEEAKAIFIRHGFLA